MEFVDTPSSMSMAINSDEIFPSTTKMGASILASPKNLQNETNQKQSNAPSSISLSAKLQSPTPALETTDLECSLCFRLFCRPVSTPCGHTYCKSCLLSALQYSLLCPLCRSKLEPPNKHKYSVNIVILNLMEKHFKEEHEQRDKEEEEEQEEQDKVNAAENTAVEMEDYYTRWTNCLIPSVRETCSVLLSCT